MLPDDDVPSPDGTPPGSAMQWPSTELMRSEMFADRQVVLDRIRRVLPGRVDVVADLVLHLARRS